MKFTITIIIFLVTSTATYSQTSTNEIDNIALFSKIWGFLKYYHPTVATGKLDWDTEFTNRINTVTSLTTKAAINNYYSKWITDLGAVKKCKSCKNIVADGLTYNLSLKWLNDTTVLTKKLSDQLNYILQNRNQTNNYYVQQNKNVGNTTFKNEKPYIDSVYPSASLRLLGLSRYWNIINYFYPYKYVIGQDWDNVLIEMIPKFNNAADTLSYHLTMLELSTKINDSHSYVSTKYTNEYFGIKWAPFIFKLIDNKAIVTGFYNDSLCKINDIQLGDVFLKVNNESIQNIITEKSKYIGASNQATRLRYFNNAVFNGQTDSVNITFERNGIIKEKIIFRYRFKQFKYSSSDYSKKDTVKILEGNIGYVNLGWVQPENVNETLNKVKNTKAIIFDVRNYPNGTMYTIANFLNPQKRAFVKFTKPDLLYPGIFKYKPTLFCGKKNSAAYKGKVILLFDETTQSHAEFTLMALQTAPKVIGIGSQTAGADGNVSEFTFPGNYVTYMTGLGVYYPDGRQTQRIGIVADINVTPTIVGLKAGKDELLIKAIEVINKQ